MEWISLEVCEFEACRPRAVVYPVTKVSPCWLDYSGEFGESKLGVIKRASLFWSRLEVIGVQEVLSW